MRIGIGLGIGGPGGPGPAAAAATAVPPTLALTLSPAAPVAGDLVTLTGLAGGTPAPTEFSALSVTIAGTAVGLAGSGLVRTFIARAGALEVTASVTTGEGTASASLSAQVAAGTVLASVAGFGSSTMEGDGASSAAAAALALIGGAVGAATVRNKGIGGTVLQNSADSSGAARSQNGRDRFAADLLGANLSDRLFILYGANDLRYTAAPATFNLAGFATDMREVLNGLLTGGYSRDRIAIGSPNWYPDTTYSVGSDGFTGSNRTIHEAYVAECAAIAAEYGLLYADVYAALRDGGGTALMSADGLHCNDAGHQVVARAFLAAVAANNRAVPGTGTATGGAAAMTLAWTAAAGATGYEVEYGVSGSYAYGNRQTVTGTTATVTALAAGSYMARLRAVFAGGTGPWAFWSGAVTVLAAGVTDTITGADSFVSDTAGTALSALSADTGAWVMHPSNTGDAVVATGGALRGPSTTSKFCIGLLDAEALTAAGVFVEMDFLIRSNNAQLTSYAVARCATASLTFLAAGYNGSAWRILKYVAGTATVLGSYSLTETAGTTPLMRLEVRPGEQRLYRNGTLLVTTTAADADLGTPGEGLGIRIASGSTAWSGTTGPQVTAVRVGRMA